MAYPIYQPARLVPHATTLVVADDPTATQVQAALTVAAAFGRMSAGQLPLSLTPEAMLSDADRSANDLIFVGPFSAPGSHAVPSDPEDGIIEIIASPWNPERVMLIVTGNSEDGILKAARALSSGNIQTSATSDLALVVNASVGQLPRSVSPVRALADLGYGNVTIDRAGPSSTEYEFFIPSGQQPAGEAALELVISHATTLDYSRSTLTINVNTEHIGSIELQDGTSQSGRTQLTLPASALRSGFNTLAIAADLIPANACGETTPPEVWLTVRPESQLQIPLAPKPNSAARELALGEYPDVFAARPALDSAAFVVAAGDVVGLQVATQIAFDLGADARGSGVTMGPTALFDDGNVLDVLTEKAPLFVGRAGRLPSIAGLSNQLPVPFAPGEDYAREVGGVVYRLPEGASIGYLEMFPWPGGDVALAVLGTDDAGLLRAAGTLLDAPALQQLSGNFAVLGADQVLAFQVDANAGSIAPSPREDEPTPQPDRPGWIVPALAVSSGLTVLVVLIVLLGAWRGRRARD
ncbi:MAG: cellulose biosynthesis cyclic di-GMP-binding regulatory protein BcsB [Anaerolineales bacterium]